MEILDLIQNQPFQIVGVEYLNDENNFNLKFRVMNFAMGKMADFDIKRTELTPATLECELKRNGGICPENCKKLCDKIEKVVNQILLGKLPVAISYAHYGIGWRFVNGEILFLADKIYKGSDVIPSRYYGLRDVSSKGNIDCIKELFNDLILSGSIALPLSMLGAASVVLSYSNLVWDTHIYNFIVHLLGSSSTGKTTILKMIASYSGNPNSQNGFFTSYLSTSNYLVEKLCDSYGHPFAIDEFSVAKVKDFTSEVYTIANGVEKGRCSAGGRSTQVQRGFQGIYVSTGENSINTRCSSNEGISARLFEITPDFDFDANSGNKFTTSSKESDKIKTVASNNYGILAPLVAKELMKNSKKYDYLRIGWLKRTKNRYEDEKLELNIFDRVSEYVAIIMTACEVMMRVLDMKFDVDRIFDFYFYHFIYKYSGDANIDVKVYDAIRSFISANRNRIQNASYDWGIPVLEDGKIGYFCDMSYKPNKDRHQASGEYYDFLFMFPIETVEDYLRSKGFGEPRVAVNSLRKRKLIKYTRSGNNPKLDVDIENIKTPMYAFWLKRGDDNIAGMRGL